MNYLLYYTMVNWLIHHLTSQPLVPSGQVDDFWSVVRLFSSFNLKFLKKKTLMESRLLESQDTATPCGRYVTDRQTDFIGKLLYSTGQETKGQRDQDAK